MKKRKNKKVRRIVFTAFSIAIPLTIILLLWTYSAEKEVHYIPDYPKENILEYVNAKELTDEEYEFLFRQTGLSHVAIDTLRDENREEAILTVQERFFREVEIGCERNFLLFREVIENQQAPGKRLRQADEVTAVIPVLEDGDILISFNTHFLGWRNGHAALVIDAENGLTLEALTMGRDTAILSVKGWLERPSFAVLRLAGVSKEERAEIAMYAKEHLLQVPYCLSAGIWESDVWNLIKKPDNKRIQEMHVGDAVTGTQCSHMIWYAYHQYGYDLDSDGGMIVTPLDLYNSSLLEVIQVYGMEIQ